jgi:tetratricopeptide (TPR) repeat protein
MRKKFLVLFLMLSLSFVYAQEQLGELIQLGIKYHDNGEYAKAIETYKKALEIDPDSPLANYEIALTYMYIGNNESAIKHCDIVIKANKEAIVDAYIVKGSALDNLGKTDESIALFEEGIKKFGENYLLCYNLGLDYYKIKDYKNTEKSLLRALAVNPYHPSSHLLLGIIKSDENQRTQSLLSLYYFLMLEPDSRRSQTAYTLLKKQFPGTPQQKDGNTINITVDPASKSEFADIEFMLSLIEAGILAEITAAGKPPTEEDLFIKDTEAFFNLIGEQKKGKKGSIYWDLYAPIFYDLVKSEHLETCCYFIRQSSSQKAAKWLEANSDKLQQFAKWLNEYQKITQ